jgi:signal transduction histidine kinase
MAAPYSGPTDEPPAYDRGRTPPGTLPVYGGEVNASAPLAPGWRLDAAGRRRFDLALASALLLPIIAFPFAGVASSATVLSILEILPLYRRRTRPVEVLAAVSLVSLVQVVWISTPVWGQVAFPVATYSVARFSTARWAWLALGVGAAGTVSATLDWLHGFHARLAAGNITPYVLTIGAIVVTAWALGTLGRTRQAYVDALVERADTVEREAAQRIELAASLERALIAREMHDAVAHGLSVIVVQADGARYAAENDPDVATEALATVAETGRTALAEMRRLLGLLRNGEQTGLAPHPRLADLFPLVEEARAAGTTVRAHLPGPDDPAVPDGVALTAYRLVQEALSNVRRHAGPGAAVTVEVALQDAALSVVVSDDGRGAAAVGASGSRQGSAQEPGLGLVGMRERVAVHGGTLDVGPRPAGGFRVAARLPL